MHIAFIDIAASYNANTPSERALGGTQSAVCYLAPELVKTGMKVSLINQFQETGDFLGVTSQPPACLDDNAALQQIDLFVFNGRWSAKMVQTLRKRTKAPFVGWMHEALFDDSFIQPLPEFAGFTFVSEWQKRVNAARLLPTIKNAVIANGIAPAFHTSPAAMPALPLRAIYSGSSKRGLLDLPAILPALHARFPDLRFDIYSDCVVANDMDVNANFRAQLLAIPNCDHVGAVPQGELAQRLQQSHIFLSPNAYPETFCIALAESMAAGLLPIITARAALPETAAGFAALAPAAEPDHPHWQPAGLNRAAFIATAIAAIEAMQNDAGYAEKRARQMAYATSHYSWQKHAGSWIEFLSGL